ncbi:NAD-binding protein [bacterium]|nr:NAD-binding protein [bacterium]
MTTRDNSAALKRQRSELWLTIQWPAIGALALLVTVLGYAGFNQYFSLEGPPKTPADLLYLTLQLFGLESGAETTKWVPWQLQLARFLAPVVTGYAVIRALLSIFREQWQRIRLKRVQDHVIVIGLGRKGTLFAQGFQMLGYPVIVIEKDQSNDSLQQFRNLGVISIGADATDKNVLRSVRVDRARYVISVCGLDEVNAEVAVHARELYTGRTTPLNCIVHVVEPQLCQLMRRQEMISQDKKLFRLDFVNLYENAIQALWTRYSLLQQEQIDGGVQPRFIIIGLGRMGETLILHLARNWKSIHVNHRPHFTVVDKIANEKTESMLLRYPYLIRTCELHPYSMNVNSAEFIRADFLSDATGMQSTSIFICLDNDSLAMSVALSLRQRLQRSETPLYVRISRESGLATLLQSDRMDLVRPFGSLEQSCTPEMLSGLHSEKLARAIHAEYVEKRMREGFKPEDARAVVPWEQLPEDLKESNRKQAEDIGSKLRAIGCDIVTLVDGEDFQFTTEELERLATMEHDRWNREKLEQGWKYGSVKNAETKETPYLVDYNQLTEEIKDYDRNAVRQIPQLLARIGFQIYRVK